VAEGKWLNDLSSAVDFTSTILSFFELAKNKNV
jgi:hypothetical protein